MQMSDLTGNLIRQLGSDPELEGWHPHLERALEEHRFNRRDASYSHPSIDQVQDTLNDGPPANAADLSGATRRPTY